MNAVMITDKERPAWDEYVMHNPASIAWQHSGWSDVVRKHYRLDYYPLAAVDNGRIRGILPLYRKRNLRGKNELISVPYAVAGGMLADDADAQALLLGKAIELCGKTDSRRITLKQYKIRINGDTRIDDNYYNRELSLSRDRKDLWSRITERNRELVTEGGKLGGRLEYPSADSALFHRLLVHHHHRRGIPCVGRKWIEDLLAFQMYSIALWKDGDRVLAGTMVKEFKDTISLPFTCLAEDGKTGTLRAAALYWSLIEHFAGEGKAIFHSGRIPNSDDTEAHRLGWGGVKHPYFYQYVPNTASTTEFAARRGRKRELFESGWKRLPLGIAGVLGPRVVKHFP